jgi:hypothetical protein
MPAASSSEPVRAGGSKYRGALDEGNIRIR